jgi:hypothetical protein
VLQKRLLQTKKGKRGRKRKKAGGVTEPDSKVARMTEVQPEVTQMTVVPEPEVIQITWRAPVARMI